MKSRSGSYQDFFYQYNSLNILLMSVSIFLFAKYFIGKKKFSDKFKKKILFFSGLTYGVYLSHVLLIEIFIRYGGFMNPRNPGFHPLAAIPILLFLVLAGSVVLSYFGKKRLWLPRLHARLVESVRQKSDKKKKSFQ
jgi:surface polysaccharide O-acyltransferase-like enzyme